MNFDDKPKTVTMTITRWKMFIFMSGIIGALSMFIAASWVC